MSAVVTVKGPRCLSPAGRAGLRSFIADIKASRHVAAVANGIGLWRPAGNPRMTGTLSPRYHRFAVAA